MKFLYPEFLYGLTALVIPVIIHLFNFRKAKKIYFSSIRFLKFVEQKTSRKRKLKHYLILASRLLFIFFLVIAFAQPYLPSSDKEPPPEDVLIWLDNSQSMSNLLGDGRPGLEQGLAYIGRLLDIYPKNTNYKLLTNDFASFSNTFKTRDELEDLLTEIHYSQISRTLSDAYSRLMTRFAAEKARRSDVFIISDFQRSTIGEIAGFQPDTANQIVMVPVEFARHSNVFVDSVYLENPYLNIDRINELHIDFFNDGSEDKKDLQIKFSVNDMQMATSNVSIPSGQKITVTFTLNFPLKKINKCKISFEDYPVAFDNEFFLVLKPNEKIRVLEIKEKLSEDPIPEVYGNADLFLFSSQNIINLDYSLINRADLVVLNGLTAVDPSLAAALHQYLNQGGTLLVVPPDDPDVNSYTRLLGIRLDTAGNVPKTSLAAPDYSNPFFSNIFQGKDQNLNMPASRNVITWQNSSVNLLKYINGDNYLSRFNRNGTIYVLGSPLTGEYTDFHRHALFVPVMYKIAFSRNKSYGRLYYTIDESLIKIKADSIQRNDILILKRPGVELIPGQRVIGNTVSLELPGNMLIPGFYQLKQEERLLDVLAFDRTKAESLLEQYKTKDLKKIFSLQKKISIFSTNSPADFAREIKKKKIGVPLWKYAVILALFFLLTEVLFIRLL